MAQKFCSFCCCSFCSSSSGPLPAQSPQQQQPIISPPQIQTIPPQTITAHSSSSSLSPTQSSQQQPISSPPQHQTITAHSSSSPQHPTPTMADFNIFLQKFKDISQIQTLIPLLEELLKVASGEKSDYGGSNSAAPSFIQDGQKMLEMLNRQRIGNHPAKKNSGNGTVEEFKKVFIEVLKGSDKIPKVGIALSMLGSILQRFGNISENREECLDVLKRMVHLGKQIMKLNEQISDEKKKLDEGVGCIIEGTIMCISQLNRATFLSFITAPVNKQSLNDFQHKVDRLCSDIQLLILADIGARVPKNAPDSQKFYSYQQKVGIEGAKETVIQLLDLNARDTKSIVVVVHGFGGIGKTTLADAVYAQLDLPSFKYCRVHMDQNCTKNDLKGLQEQILNGLFSVNIKLKDCDEGQGMLWSSFKHNTDKPLFLYIDNGLKSTDLEQLLPKDLDSCLPPKSRILVTTRNVDETDLFVGVNIAHKTYDVNPLPDVDARKLLLKNVSDYNDEDNIVKLLKLCGGVPLLLELAGSQLAINKEKTKNIVLEMLNEGEHVKKRDISDRMVGFVYDRLLPPVQQAFLDIVSFFYGWSSEYVASIVGEEEFRALKAASFVKTSEYGSVIVHDIVRARGKKLSDQEGNRITDVNTLSECLKDDEKLKKLRGIYFQFGEKYEQPAIEINCHDLNRMNVSLRVLNYKGFEITFREKCQKPFEQLKCLRIYGDAPDLPMELPMELEKLEHLVCYDGPFTQGMNLYEFPPSLRFCTFSKDCSENRVAYSKVPPKVTQPSSLVRLTLDDFRNMQRLSDGVEKLTKLERLELFDCHGLKELPSNFGQLKNLEYLDLENCSGLVELPSDFGKLQNLERLNLGNCSGLVELPSDFGKLQNLVSLCLDNCSGLVELPSDFGKLQNLESLDLSKCSGLVELPSDFGELVSLKELTLTNCSKLEEWPLSFGDLKEMRKIDLSGCGPKLKDSLPKNIKGINCKIVEDY